MSELVLTPGQVTLTELERIWREGLAVRLADSARQGIVESAARIDAAAHGDVPVYGVNTGFGKLASIKIKTEDTATLQRNLILSHCCGVGDAIPRAHARLLMVLKLLSFGRGASGVRWAFVELLEAMLARGVTPVIPAQGSVGASGDLAPLSHMTAVLIGHGDADAPPARLLNAHFAAIRTLGGESEAAETVCEAIRAHHDPKGAMRLAETPRRLAMLLAAGRRLRDGVSPDWIDWAELVEAELALDESTLEGLATEAAAAH